MRFGVRKVELPERFCLGARRAQRRPPRHPADARHLADGEEDVARFAGLTRPQASTLNSFSIVRREASRVRGAAGGQRVPEKLTRRSNFLAAPERHDEGGRGGVGPRIPLVGFLDYSKASFLVGLRVLQRVVRNVRYTRVGPT